MCRMGKGRAHLSRRAGQIDKEFPGYPFRQVGLPMGFLLPFHLFGGWGW